MDLTNLKVIGITIAGGLVVGAGGGYLWALAADKVGWHGVGTGLFLVGILVVSLGLMGAAEPQEGWSSKRAGGRRSMVSRVMPDDEERQITSAMLAAWALLAGLPLLGLSMWAFSAAV